jgi:hypothetical protein
MTTATIGDPDHGIERFMIILLVTEPVLSNR